MKGYLCDHCSAFEPVRIEVEQSIFSYGRREEMPSGWITTRVGDDVGSRHFCSQLCLLAFAETVTREQYIRKDRGTN